MERRHLHSSWASTFLFLLCWKHGRVYSRSVPQLGKLTNSSRNWNTGRSFLKIHQADFWVPDRVSCVKETENRQKLKHWLDVFWPSNNEMPFLGFSTCHDCEQPTLNFQFQTENELRRSIHSFPLALCELQERKACRQKAAITIPLILPDQYPVQTNWKWDPVVLCADSGFLLCWGLLSKIRKLSFSFRLKCWTLQTNDCWVLESKVLPSKGNSVFHAFEFFSSFETETNPNFHPTAISCFIVYTCLIPPMNIPDSTHFFIESFKASVFHSRTALVRTEPWQTHQHSKAGLIPKGNCSIQKRVP